MNTDHLHRLIDLAAAQLDQSATLDGLTNCEALTKARAELAEIDAQNHPGDDRRPVFSFEVDGQHVRWSGTLRQYHQDRRNYVDASQGYWVTVSTHCHKWVDRDGTNTIFRAIPAHMS